MANPFIAKAAGGAGDGRAALPWDSFRELMEFITLTLFLLSF